MIVNTKGMGNTLDNQPWYCNGSILSGWLGCDKYLPTSEDQQQMMYQDFGPGVPQNVQDQAVQSFGSWLQSMGYDSTVQNLSGSSWFSSNWPVLAIGAVMGVLVLGDGGPKRYGR